MSIPRKPVPGTPDRSTTSSIIMPTPPSSSRASSSRHPSNPFYAASSSASESLLDTPNPDLSNTAPRIQVSESPSTRTDRKVGGPSTRPRSSSARVPNSPSATTLPPPQSQQPSTRQRSASHTHTRNNSLPQRFPGDMSHRPLAILKRENRTANRSSRHRRAPSQPDTIDALDTIGGGYHHDGPYEATLASRNVNVRYSPLEAVRNSNMEALRATPREFIEDSLRLHVPLQGTSIVPSGGLDMSGNVMTYREGADLMRESDAPGGPYRRYQDVVCQALFPSPSLTYELTPSPSTIIQMTSRAKANPPLHTSATSKPRNESISSAARASTQTTSSYHPPFLLLLLLLTAGAATAA